MDKCYLAIDIGASSGRHILSYMEKGKLKLEEIYRFPNGLTKRKGTLCWNHELLFKEILTGMKKCHDMGYKPESVGIDTWGVDFVLLDDENKIIGDMVGYRDKRTDGMDNVLNEIVSEEKVYERTGIQKQLFNTIYQLLSVKETSPKTLEKAKTFLMVPDYFHYLLTGVKCNEYTNATTTQLVNAKSKEWDLELIAQLGIPTEMFQKVEKPGTAIGSLKEEIAEKVGYQCKVVLSATHDTGSAVVAVPSDKENVLYISSGTWSLLGTERKEADCSEKSRVHNFTNEGGYEYRFRYLKNIMGLWMIQSIKKELKETGIDFSFQQICNMAEKATIESRVDCDDKRFLAPENMVEEIRNACKEGGMKIPITISQLAQVVYCSLAECYKKAVEEVEELTNCQYDSIYIVGGGSNADYLNRLTANTTKRDVYAGPGEATAIGNAVVQMITDGEFTSLQEAKQCILESFEIKIYKPVQE